MGAGAGQGQGKTSLHQPLPEEWGGEVESVQLDPALVPQLRLLDAVNMVEQGEEQTTLTRLPNIRAVWKDHLASLSPPPVLTAPLFARFFHFVCGGEKLPCVRLSSATVGEWEAFHRLVVGAGDGGRRGGGEESGEGEAA